MLTVVQDQRVLALADRITIDEDLSHVGVEGRPPPPVADPQRVARQIVLLEVGFEVVLGPVAERVDLEPAVIDLELEFVLRRHAGTLDFGQVDGIGEVLVAEAVFAALRRGGFVVGWRLDEVGDLPLVRPWRLGLLFTLTVFTFWTLTSKAPSTARLIWFLFARLSTWKVYCPWVSMRL